MIANRWTERECVLNDFEQEDTLDDFVIEITDLDSDRKKVRTSVFWLNGQRLWSQARHWMTVLTVVGMTILMLTLSPSSALQFSQGSQKAPDRTPGHSLPQTIQQTITCTSSSAIILIVIPSNNDTRPWYKLPMVVWSETSNSLPSKTLQGVWSCSGSDIIIIQDTNK